MNPLFKEYANEKIWVASRHSPGKNGKVDKMPINPNSTGMKAASTKDPDTWGTLKEAQQKCREIRNRLPHCDAEVGIVITGTPDLCYFDLDDCISEAGEVAEDAKQLLRDCGKTYAYRTPSGRGLRIVVRDPGASLQKQVQMNGWTLEIFQNSNRYVVVPKRKLKGRDRITGEGAGVRDRLLKRDRNESVATEKSHFDWGDDTGAEFTSISVRDPGAFDHDRSRELMSDVASMLGRGMSPTDCLRCAEETPAAEKYGARLRDEVKRCCEKFSAEHGQIPYFQTDLVTRDRHDQRILQGGRQIDKTSVKEARTFLGLEDFFDPKPQNWLVDEQIPVGTTGILFGSPGTFKTFYALKVGMSLAAGRQPFKKEGPAPDACEPVHMVMIAGEGQSTLRLRIMALCQEELGTEFDFTVLPVQENFADRDAVADFVHDLREHLDEVAKGMPVFVVIDTLSQNMVGDENGNEATLFIRNVEWMRRQLELRGVHATVMIVHHTSKQGRQYRGHSSLHGNSDWMLQMNRQSDQIVSVHRYKSKIAPAGVGAGTLQLKKVVVNKYCPIDGFMDDPEEGVNDTLVVETRLLEFTPSAVQTAETDEWLRENYVPGIRMKDLSDAMRDHFSWGKKKAVNSIREWMKIEGTITESRGDKNAVVLVGELTEVEKDE